MVSNHPLVSAIIPCRNGAAWLAEAIESCLYQVWPYIEIIVVDNGSTDASRAVAEQYKSYSVVLLECARKGASAARNLGLEHARGEFIQFLDADDILHPEKIRVQLERLRTAPVLSIASGAWARFRHDRTEAEFRAEAVWRDLGSEEFLISSWLGGGMMPNFAWLTPREVIDKAGPWNEQLTTNDDGEFFCRAVLAGAGIVFCAQACGYYRSGIAATLSGRRDRAARESELEAVELCSEWLLQRCCSAAAFKACATSYQRFIFSAYPEVPDLVRTAERRVVELGGSDLRIDGGAAFKTVSRCFGWKAAKRCQWHWQRGARGSGDQHALFL